MYIYTDTFSLIGYPVSYQLEYSFRKPYSLAPQCYNIRAEHHGKSTRNNEKTVSIHNR